MILKQVEFEIEDVIMKEFRYKFEHIRVDININDNLEQRMFCRFAKNNLREVG